MTVSTILVMGPPRSRKSDFIKILAGPEKLKPNATSTDDLGSIAISPYFADNGDTIRLVKFPGFSHQVGDPTDADLLITFAVYLEGMRRRQEPISGIIYTHRIDDDGLNGDEVKRNLRMLRAIAGDQQQSRALQNVVVVTTNWDTPAPSGVDRAAKQRDLPGLMNPVLNLNSNQYMRHDGSKWSALRIVDIIKGKTPRLLYIQTQLQSNPDPVFTKAAEEMVGDVNTFLREKRTEDSNIRDQLWRTKGRRDANQVTTLSNQLAQLGVVLDRLRAEEDKLGTPVDWDQASRDSAQLEEKIEGMRVAAATDWKAEYDRIKSEYDAMKNKYDGMKTELNSCQARSKALQSERNTLQADYNRNYGGLDRRIRVSYVHGIVGGVSNGFFYLGASFGEILTTNGIVLTPSNPYPSPSTPVYQARKPATGMVGFVVTGMVEFV